MARGLRSGEDAQRIGICRSTYSIHLGRQRRLGARAKVGPEVSETFEVRHSDSAREDCFGCSIACLRTRTAGLDAAQMATSVIRDTIERSLSWSPFVYALRAVALYEIDDADHGTVLAARPQFGDGSH